MITEQFSTQLARIAGDVRGIVRDPVLRPDFAPKELIEAVMAYPKAGGKALRPALLTWACEALGGTREIALPAAAAVELYHIYTLVHDDVIDRDPMRRGQPSVHALMARVGEAQFALPPAEAAHYGTSMAILAGDALHSWSILLLATLPKHGVDPAVAARIIRRMEGQIGPAIVEGETRDIQLPFLPVDEVVQPAILRVVITKTSALFAFCAWAGGLLARGNGHEDEDVRSLTAFAERAGIAFQLQDDVLGLVADEAVLGKPVGSDLREGKRTMILALAWERANEDERRQLAQVLGHPDAASAQIADATALLRRLGAIDDVQAMANTYLDEAYHHLDCLPQTPATDLLRELATVIVKRQK